MFENLKVTMQKKIEKNSVKSLMTWIDKDGIPHEEVVVMKRSQEPLVGDWARIYPPVNEDGSWNLTNLLFGGKKNLIKLIAILILVGLVLLGFYEAFQAYDALASMPCVEACTTAMKIGTQGLLG